MIQRKSLLKLVLRLTVLLFVIKAINSTDPYVKELHQECFETKRPYFCVKYRLLKIVQDLDYEGPDNSIVKLVKLKTKSDSSYVFPTPRYQETDSEWEKLVKFFKRKIIRFFSTHGIAFHAPDGLEVVEEKGFDGEGRNLDKESNELQDHPGDARGGSKIKEKKIFILSVLIVAKLIKIMMILNMVFFSLLVIKKILLMTAVVFPSVLSHIKQACQKHHTTVIAEEPSHSHPPHSSWFGWRQDDINRNSYW